MSRAFRWSGNFFVIMLIFFTFLGNEAFAECEDKLDIVFVLDVSGSMSGSCAGGTKMDCLKDGTKAIIDSSEMDESRVGIFTFSSSVRKVVDLTDVTGNRGVLKNYVDSMAPSGSTALGDGLKQGLEYLNANVGTDRKGIIILLTDGMVNSGSLNTPMSVENYVSDNWRNGPIEIYTVGTGQQINKNMLERIAEYTHGRLYHATGTCDGNCIAGLFLDAIVHAKSGFRVSYLFTNCNEMLSKTIKFDACATNISDYPPGSKSITDISIVDSVTDNLSYVGNTGVITYIDKTTRDSYPMIPDENVVGDRRTLTFNATDITENMTIIVNFGLINNTMEFDAVSGTKNNATSYYAIDGVKYSIDDYITFAFYCDCPPPPIGQCNGIDIVNNTACPQDRYMCDEIGGIRILGYRDMYGDCAAKPGCYCIEDPWAWITSPDHSPEACECIIMQNNMWDYGRAECCNVGDCWISSDRTWICDDGVRKEGSFFCEDLYACGRDWYWNMSIWVDRLPDGCECENPENCESGQCITGICLTLANPNISFTSESLAAELGSKFQVVISVKNNIAVADTIKIKLHADPEKMLHWAKFENGRNEIDVSLNEYEEKLVPIEIFAGQTGTYKMTIYANSALVPSLYGKDEQYIQIVHRETGLTSRTPGIGWSGMLMVMIVCGVLAARRM